MGRLSGINRFHVRLRMLLATALAAAATAATPAAPPTVRVILASEPSLNATSTLLLGEKDAVLVDVPFTRSDGHRLVAEVLESGRTLRTIYISHDHPDHFLSLEVLAQAFPNARIVTAAPVVDDIWRSLPFKLRRWGPMLGANGPRHPVVPESLAGDSFTLEGNEIRVLGPLQGDHVTRDYLVAFEAEVQASKNSADLIARLKKRFPQAHDYIDGFILTNSAQVAMGETPPWTE